MRRLGERVRNLTESRKGKVWLFLVVLAALCLAMYLYSHRQTSTKISAPVTAAQVKAYTVVRQDMEKRLTMSGETVPNIRVDIAPKYTGRITDIRADLGSAVKAGDILVVQDTQDLDISIMENRAAWRQAQADSLESQASYESSHVKAQVDFENANTTYQRYQTLYTQGAVSKQELDNKYQEMMAAKTVLDSLVTQDMGGIPAQIESKRAASEKARYVIEGLEKQRDDMILRAPNDGVVTYRNAEIGMLPQSGTTLLTIVDNSHMYVDCKVAELDISNVQVGLPIDVTIDSLGKTYTGKIIYVSPAMTTDTRAYIVRILLDNPDAELRAGMFASAVIHVLQRKDTLYVPRDAVVERNGSIYVYVIRPDGTAEQRTVKTGVRNDDSIEILSGIQAGEQVAYTNLARLQTGSKVEIQAN